MSLLRTEAGTLGFRHVLTRTKRRQFILAPRLNSRYTVAALIYPCQAVFLKLVATLFMRGGDFS